MLTQDAITSKNYDELCNRLMPWGSSDVWHCIKTAEAVGLYMYELAEILREQADDFCINLFDTNKPTDINALLNDYILNEFKNEVSNKLKIDYDDNFGEVYFFANYLDCPLQYKDKKSKWENKKSKKTSFDKKYAVVA